MNLFVVFRLFRSLAAAFFFLATLGGSKCSRFLYSGIIDSCCTLFVNLLRKPSKLSPSLIFISTNIRMS